MDSSERREDPVSGFFEHGNETSDSVKAWEFYRINTAFEV
jgi:hypothetical protein